MKVNILYCVVLLAFNLTSCKNKIENSPSDSGEKTTTETTMAPDAILKNSDDLFEETVYNVIKALKTQDEHYLNTIVSKEYEVVVLYRSGVFNEYKYLDKITFKSTDPSPDIPFNALRAGYNLKYESLPSFNCGTMEWSKNGLYCDTITNDTLLSGTPENLIKYRGDKIPAIEVKKLKELEAKSRRIALAHKSEGFVFYLTLIGNKWYLTALDRVTTDCSA